MRKFSTFLNEDKAQEGEGHVLYHASQTKNISKFHPLSHFSTSKALRTRADDISRGSREGPGRKTKSIYAVRLKHGRSFETEDVGEHYPHEILHHLHSKGMFSKEEYARHSEKLDNSRIGHQGNYLAKAIRSKGYHSQVRVIKSHSSKSPINTDGNLPYDRKHLE